MGFVYYWFRFLSVDEHAATLDRQVSGLAQKAAENASAAAALEEQVRSLGQEPVVEAPPADDGMDYAALLRAARAAVEDYCAHDRCRGADGEAPNMDAIVSDVLALVRAPRDGEDGEDGQDAPPVTSDELFNQVAAYCGQPEEPCRGAPGEDGEDGQTPPCMSEPSQCQGPKGDKGDPGPTCPPGYTANSRTNDPTPLAPDSGDEETWWVCVANEEN
ncbi:hypothetical protein [Prauserella endophytica]|uniref:Collagen-like protein n=1 Tax=Prauserella endophytica TaxID=1592324 RepID=A0ABY2RW82_9PSEU|nr:hypothetical protein [Prauserella endophytica]TKG63092.1 hypothetical protein FCN18_30440 [Prauserella endophytica]